jgi:hypothetical protein
MGGLSLAGKIFRVVRNDGDSPETAEGTLVTFSQRGDLVFAIWSGGVVRAAQLAGVLEGGRIRHAYFLINQANEIRAGRGTMEISERPDGKLRLVESWDWTEPPGRGLCTMDEV